MTQQIPTSIRIGKSLLKRLDTLSNRTKRSKNNIISIALEKYIDSVEDNNKNGEDKQEIKQVKFMIQRMISRTNILTKQLDNTQKRITLLEKKNE